MASHSSSTWSSPGGLYVVPEEWRARFLSEFPDYRVRWSIRGQCWQIEQAVGRGALDPFRIDEADDSLVRARDGYWLVMSFQPGDRMPCPGIIQKEPRQVCGYTMRVSHRKSAEAVCNECRRRGRDGRTVAAYWPFDECLLEHLRYTDPLRGGISRMRADADARNAKMLRDAERAQSNVVQANAYDLHRHVVGIKQWGYNHTSHPIDNTPIPVKD